MYWQTEDHHQQNYYANFQIVQHQNGIQQPTAAVTPQQQQQQQPQHSAPPPPQQQHQQQQQHHHHQQPQQQYSQQQSSHRSAHTMPMQQMQHHPQHQHHQWPKPPTLTAPPFFQQIRTTVPSSGQYCTAPPPQFFNPQRVTQTSAVPSSTQQRPCLPPGSALYQMPPPATNIRPNIVSQPPPGTSAKPSTQQVQMQYYSASLYCQPPLGQPNFGHVITPTVPEIHILKHRKHAIPIIDPTTKENILERELRRNESMPKPTPSPPPPATAAPTSTSSDLNKSKNDQQDPLKESNPNEQENHQAVLTEAYVESMEKEGKPDHDGDNVNQNESINTTTITLSTNLPETMEIYAAANQPLPLSGSQKPLTLLKAAASKTIRLQRAQKQSLSPAKPPARKSKRSKRLKDNQKKQKGDLEDTNRTANPNEHKINAESSNSNKLITKVKENITKGTRIIKTEGEIIIQDACGRGHFAIGGSCTSSRNKNTAEGPVKIGDCSRTSNNDDASVELYENPKLTKSEQIAFEILGIESTDDNELLFLNSSVSGYEEDICYSPTQKQSENLKTNDILFGDFSQGIPGQEISAYRNDESQEENDLNAFPSETFNEEKKHVYTLQELKAIANEPASKLPPTFRGKVCDIIGKNPRASGAAAAQMYQQISFKDSINYLNRKRNKRLTDAPSYQQQYEQQQRNADIIRINLSLNEEIQLAKSENAWVPAGLQNRSSKTESEDDEQILKKVRGILNKLTPENFDKLLQSAANFPMTGVDRMKKVMLLIFEKTVSEPNFAPTYARFCKFLFNQNHSIFKTILIKRMQEEFESNVNNAKAKNAKLRPLVDRLAATSDPKEQLELKAELDDQEYQFRRRAWGTVRFIGEMFKLGFLATERVCTCVENLLDPRCEEKLEYMCKLLTTVGAQLEPLNEKQQSGGGGEQSKISERLDATFITIKHLVEKKKHAGQKISSRVRFMMQDVLELRTRAWDQKGVTVALPSRDVSPTMTSRPTTPSQRDQRMNSSYTSSGGYEKRKPSSDGQKNSSQLNIDVSKLPVFSTVETTRQLGNSSLLMWKTVGRTQSQPAPLPSTQNSGVIRAPQPDINESTTPEQDELSSRECERLLNGLIEVAIEEESKKEWFTKWKEIPATHHPAIIYHLLTEYLHSAKVKRPEIDACSRLFTSLMGENLLKRSSFTEGYRKFSEIWDDILVDVPKGWHYVFNFLGPLLHLELIPFDLIWDKNWSNTTGGDKFLQAMIIHFTSEFGANYMRYFWECHSLRWDKFIAEERVAPFVTINRFEFIENDKCIPPIFIQRSPDELVQHIKRLLQQSDQNVDLIIDFISTNVHIGCSFVQNLTMFLCDYTVIYSNTFISSSSSSSSTNSKAGTSKKSKLTDSPPSSITTANTASSSYKLRKDVFVTKCIPLLRLCIDSKDDHELSCLDAIVHRCKQLYDSSAEDLICAMLAELYGEVISKESFEKWHQQQLQGDNILTNDFNTFFEKLTI